jgi:RimJ/RimL family protein N-acetyltransferase
LLESAIAGVISPDVRPSDYIRFVPPDWRDNDKARQIVEDRMAALEQVGARLLVERLRLEWRAGTPIPAPSARLAFRPVTDRAELVGLMTLVLDGTLDAHSREALSRGSAGEAAAEQYDGEFMSYSSPRDWWRVATLPDGEPVGFVIPARNDYNPIIAYIGVLPRHRGRGYIDDLLAEGTRILAANDVPRIRASTDLANVPMANAFQRAGYVVYQRQVDMTWARER